jgi:dTDP-4-amino-4,6-dideoxygalactose transaminase
MRKNRLPLFKVFMPETVSQALNETLFSGYIAEGEKTTQFTKLVSQFIENPRTVLTNSCTTSLLIAYRLSDVGPGDEVITTPLTSIATNVPILTLGAKPVWADVDPETGLSDPKDIEKLITKRTKAIVLLHKDGDSANIDEIIQIAKKHNIKLIEDAAHAFGASYNGKKIGNHGDFICFSFQAIKQITTGDGGAIICKDEELYLRAKKLKWFGIDHDNMGPNPWGNDVTEIGYKGNMNDISATIGIEQTKNIDQTIDSFHKNGELYSELLKNIPGITILKRDPGAYSTYWTYVMLADKRDELMKMLNENGIDAKLVHPRNDVWSIFKESKRDLPNVDYFEKHEISLPCGWWVTREDVQEVCELIKEFSK